MRSPTEIETARHDAGLTQKALCAEADISVSTYWRWLRGHQAPNTATLSRADRALTALLAEKTSELEAAE